jgi:hypothetical protein
VSLHRNYSRLAGASVSVMDGQQAETEFPLQQLFQLSGRLTTD